MSFLEIANSNFLLFMVIIILLVVYGTCGLMFVISLKRAKELNIDKKLIKNIIKTSAIFSVIPSVGVVLGLAALAPALGLPWSWLRLSVIGSVSYELMAANMATGALGFKTLQEASTNPSVFPAIMFAMSFGMAGGMAMDFIFIKHVKTLTNKLTKNSGDFKTVAMSVLFVAVIAVFLGPIFTENIVFILTFLTSIAIALIQGLLMTKFGWKWLENFALAFTLIFGMASSVAWTAIVG